MVAELRCPDCRAKLRLPEAPEAGTDVECPKCGTVFPAPEPDDDDAPKKKKPAADADEKPKKGTKEKDADDADDTDEKKKEKKNKKTKTKTKGAADPNVPKKRKAKKKETSNLALIAVIGLGLFMLLCVGGTLIWFFARTPKSVEMMYYLPEDCEIVQGINLGHAQKYPEFYKSLSDSFKDKEFKAAGDALAKAIGAADIDAVIDYVVFGASKSGSAVVIRTKSDFDPGALAKLPGAETKSLGGKTYYLVTAFKGGSKVRVFAPTNRLIVYCPELSDPVFQKMLDGHANSRDKTVGVRAGSFGKRVTTGTFWLMTVYSDTYKAPSPLPPPAPGVEEDGKMQGARMMVDMLANSKAAGFKASIGSKEVRFEVIVWCSDSEKASNVSTKFKESELAKGDEGIPPRWWKELTTGLGSKKVEMQLLNNLGFGSSGELFYARSAVETVEVKSAISNMSNRLSGTDPNAPPPAPPPAPPAKGPRRRVWARR